MVLASHNAVGNAVTAPSGVSWWPVTGFSAVLRPSPTYAVTASIRERTDAEVPDVFELEERRYKGNAEESVRYLSDLPRANAAALQRPPRIPTPDQLDRSMPTTHQIVFGEIEPDRFGSLLHAIFQTRFNGSYGMMGRAVGIEPWRLRETIRPMIQASQAQEAWRTDVVDLARRLEGFRLKSGPIIQTWAASVLTGELDKQGRLFSSEPVIDRSWIVSRLSEIITGIPAIRTDRLNGESIQNARLQHAELAGFRRQDVEHIFRKAAEAEKLEELFQNVVLSEAQTTTRQAVQRLMKTAYHLRENDSPDPEITAFAERLSDEAVRRAVLLATFGNGPFPSELMSLETTFLHLGPSNRAAIRGVWKGIHVDDQRLLMDHPGIILRAVVLAQSQVDGESTSAAISTMVLGSSLQRLAAGLRKGT